MYIYDKCTEITGSHAYKYQIKFVHNKYFLFCSLLHFSTLASNFFSLSKQTAKSYQLKTRLNRCRKFMIIVSDFFYLMADRKQKHDKRYQHFLQLFFFLLKSCAYWDIPKAGWPNTQQIRWTLIYRKVQIRIQGLTALQSSWDKQSELLGLVGERFSSKYTRPLLQRILPRPN